MCSWQINDDDKELIWMQCGLVLIGARACLGHVASHVVYRSQSMPTHFTPHRRRSSILHSSILSAFHCIDYLIHSLMVMTMAMMINVFNVHFDISLKAWPVLAFKVSCPICPNPVIEQKIGHYIFPTVTLFVRFSLNVILSNWQLH